MAEVDDLIIIGAGPAGMAAAINAASEGLSVRVLESSQFTGGQMKESYSIENYPGFPDGVTGAVLADNLLKQALKFGTKITAPVNVQKIKVGKLIENEPFMVLSDDYQVFTAKAILLTMGLQYRRLGADSVSHFMGRGVSYGIPASKIPTNRTCNVGVVGGANSAGQAVVKLAANKKMKIRLLVRKTLGHQMSMYLIERIARLPNVEVCEYCEVVKVWGKDWLEQVDVEYQLENAEPTVVMHKMDYLFIFIGGIPRTLWIEGVVELDDKKFVLTTGPTPYSTSVPGIFAAGDIRAGSVKRIAASSGEGVTVIPYIHQYLASKAGV